MANYSFGRKPIPDVENGHVFIGDNFCQLNPHTAILEGKTGLKFINCNLVNCDVPLDSTFEGCHPYHIEHCSNVHPNFVDNGIILIPCAVNCSHVISVENIVIDGTVVSTNYIYEDKVVT